MSRYTRSRRYCWTINNPTPAEIDQLRDSFSSERRNEFHITYAIFGHETGDSGTPHVQGFFCFDLPRSILQVKGIPGMSRGHFETCRGTVQQNIAYCSKDGQFEEFGVPPQQGKRSDLEQVAHLVTQGKNIKEIAEDCPVEFIKFSKGIEKLIALQQPVRQFKTDVYWFWGPTGTGKSKTAFEMAEAAISYYVKDPTNKWWDGYEQQEIVILDDYRRDFCTFASLLRLFDRYPMTVEGKGFTTNFCTRTIVLTTPKNPQETWEGRSEEDIQQLIRRITEVRHFSQTVFNPNI